MYILMQLWNIEFDELNLDYTIRGEVTFFDENNKDKSVL